MAISFDDLPDAPAGAVTFDDLPPAPAPAPPAVATLPKRQIGPAEGAARGLAQLETMAVRGLGDEFLGPLAVLADVAATGVGSAVQAAGGPDLGLEHAPMEAYTRYWTNPLRQRERQLEQSYRSEYTPLGKLGKAAGSLVGMLAPGIVLGSRVPALPPTQAAAAAPGAMPATVGEAIAREVATHGAPGVVAMTPTAVAAGADTFDAARRGGATPFEAIPPAAAQVLTTQAMGALPAASSGSALVRAGQGAVLGAGSLLPQHAAVQALLPEKARAPLTDEDIYTNAGMMSLLSVLMGRRGGVAVTREQMNQEAFAPYADEIQRVFDRAQESAKAKEYRAIFDENRDVFAANGIESFDDPRVQQMIAMIEAARERRTSEPIAPEVLDGTTHPRATATAGRVAPDPLPDVIPLGQDAPRADRSPSRPTYPEFAAEPGTAAGEKAQRAAEDQQAASAASAFSAAESRRARRDEDRSAGSVFSSYQPGDTVPAAREAIAPEDFTFVGTIRGGKLVGDEVKLTGRTRVTTDPEGKETTEYEATFIDKEGQPVEWVPESMVISKSRPKSPRYAQDLTSRQYAPPAGVGKTSNPSPRAATERISAPATREGRTPGIPETRPAGKTPGREVPPGMDEQTWPLFEDAGAPPSPEEAARLRDTELEISRLEEEKAIHQQTLEEIKAQHPEMFAPEPKRRNRVRTQEMETTDKNGVVRKVRIGGDFSVDQPGDTLLDTIGRRGGLRWDDAAAEGFDSEGMRAAGRSRIGFAPFKKNGTRTLDELARVLHDDGIIPTDNPNDLAALIHDEMAGRGAAGAHLRDVEGNAETAWLRRQIDDSEGAIADIDRRLATLREQAPRPAEDTAPPEDFGLDMQDPASLRELADRIEASRRADAERAAQEEANARADAERSQFELTGSPRPADANPRQGDLLSATGRPREAAPSAPKTEAERWADVDRVVDSLDAQSLRDAGRKLNVSGWDTLPVDALREQVKASELADVEAALRPFWPHNQRGFINLAPVADAVTKTLKAVFGDWRSPETRNSMREFAERMADVIGGVRGRYRRTNRNAASEVFHNVLASADGNLRSLAKGFKSDTLKALADKIHAPAGRASGVARTFDEAVAAEANSRLARFEKAVSNVLRASGLYKDKAAYDRVVKMLENPARPRVGAEGQVAGAISAHLADLLSYMKAAGVDVGEVKGYFPRQFDTGAVAARMGDFLTRAEQAYRMMGSQPAEAKLQAKALYDSVIYGDSGRPGESRKGGVAVPQFIKGRVFSPQAYAVLDAGGFYVKDLESSLVNYTHRAVRRAEIARRWGDGFKDWDAFEQQVLSEDPNAIGVMHQVRDLTAVMTGVQHSSAGAAGQQALSAVRTWTSLALLSKAVLTSLGESTLAPVRATKGDAGDVVQLVDNLRLHTEAAVRKISGLPPSQRLAAARALAEDTGIIAGTGVGNLQAARFMGGDPLGELQGTALAKFFERNLLSQWTDHTRVTSTVSGQVFLRRLAKDLLAGEKKNAWFLRELGVPAGEEAAFAKWLSGQLQGREYHPASISGKYGEMYRTALLRFVDQTVMRPTNATRPAWANSPLGSVVFQLNAFNYAFQKNFINRWAKTGAAAVKGAATGGAKSADGFTAADTAGMVGMLAVSGVALTALNYAVGELRDALYTSKDARELTPEAKVERAVSRSGLFGVADPYMQSLSGTRYDRSVSAGFVGPGVSNAMRAVDTAGKLAGAAITGGEADVTTAQKRQAARTLYDFGIAPAAQLLMTPLPISPATVAATVYGVPVGRDPFVDLVAGKKDYKARNEGKPVRGLLEDVVPGFDSRSPAELRQARIDAAKKEAKKRREAALKKLRAAREAARGS